MFQRRPSASDLFEILVREHFDMLIAFLRSLGVREDLVDDIAQESLMVAWRRLADFDRARPFGPWLRGIAARVAMAQRRQAIRGASGVDPAVLEALESMIARFERQPGDTFAERAARLEGCLQKLPATLREVVELAYGRGMLLGEIAASVDSSEEAIKKRIQRARVILSRCVLGQTEGVEELA